MLEIERKFLMQGFPENLCDSVTWQAEGLSLITEVEIEQGYVSIEPEVRIHTARDLATGKIDYRLTLKSDGTLTRKEIVTDVSEEFYENARQMLAGAPIKKLYRKYAYGNYVLEVCFVDADSPTAFYYGEIEFASEKEALVFTPPEWLGEEVTDDASYKMKNYWKRTRQFVRKTGISSTKAL